MFKNIWFSVLILLITFSLISCTTCTNEKIESLQRGDWTAELIYRVCGSYSGFTVSIFRTSDGEPGSGQGEKEPFSTFVRSSEPFTYQQPPIEIEWIAINNLLIRHLTRNNNEDSNATLKISKARSNYQNVAITYEPAIRN